MQTFIFLHSDGDALHLASQLRDQGNDRSRVNSSGQKHAYGNVGNEMGTHRIHHRLANPFLYFFRGDRERRPPPMSSNVMPANGGIGDPIASAQERTGWKSHDASIQRPRFRDAAPQIEPRD